MQRPGTETFAHPLTAEKIVSKSFLIVLALFLSLRIFSWANVSLLESRDSISFVRDANVFRSFNLSRIIDLPPDTAPLYPFFTAIFSLPGWSIENGARFCSLFFSAMVFLTIAGISRRLSIGYAVLVALLLLSLNPVMIGLSRSVLTEPIYIGVVYLGLWIFHRHYERPTWKSGLLVGAIFACAFLARTEGLIYLIAVPVLQFALALFFLKPKYNLRRLAPWMLAFILGFGLLSAPQIWRVSHKMGMLAINGRQAWEVILDHPDGKSYDQKIYGLDYSPHQINLEYIQSHPETVKAMVSTVSAGDILRKMIANVKDFLRRKLLVLIGPLGMIFTALGIFALWRERKLHDIVWIAGFLGASLLGPFLHDVDVRHIAVITPLLTLLQGIGIVWICKIVAQAGSLRPQSRYIAIGLPILLVIVMVIGFAKPLRAALSPPRADREYALDDFNAPLEILQAKQEALAGEPAKVAGRKGYLAYLANAPSAFLPYTDYAGLMEYCRFNRVGFVFIEYDTLRGFPFLENFANRQTPGFELLFEGRSKIHGVFELYRFLEEQ